MAKLERGSQVIAGHEWDPTLKEGDFVCLHIDGNITHIYEVREFHQRILMDHEFFNNPSLAARGFKPGDELPPSLVIQRVRWAPTYELVGPRQTWRKKIDADRVYKVTLGQIQNVIDNLNSLADTIRERDSAYGN